MTAKVGREDAAAPSPAPWYFRPRRKGLREPLFLHLGWSDGTIDDLHAGVHVKILTFHLPVPTCVDIDCLQNFCLTFGFGMSEIVTASSNNAQLHNGKLLHILTIITFFAFE